MTTLTSFLNKFNSLSLTIGNDLSLDKDHNYFYNGEKISATSATTFMSKNWDKFDFEKNTKFIKKESIEESRIVGNTIHKLIELNQFSNVTTLLNTIFPEAIDIAKELIVWNSEYNLIGMIDMLILNKRDGKYELVIVDHKVTKWTYKSKKVEYVSYQSSIYALILSEFVEFLSKELGQEVEIKSYLNLIAKDKNFSASLLEVPNKTEEIKGAIDTWLK